MKKDYANGEHFLLLHAPIFKRRYTVDCDIVMGCSIGCRFCYYRWIAGAAEYFGTGKLRRLCTPEKLAETLAASRLVRKDRDGIMLCARSDGSMQVDEIKQFLQVFKYRNPIFLLHRGYFGPRQLEAFGADERVVFCTTITPRGRELGWTPVDEFLQLERLAFLIRNGIPPRRISVEIGPVNENNVRQAVEILQRLEDTGLEFAVYRGVSVGTFNWPSPEKDLKKAGFLTGQKPNALTGHAYYRIKNSLSPEVEEKLLRVVGELRLHRFTGTLYRDEFGLDVAYNRNNRWRREMGPFPETDPAAIGSFVAGLGYQVTGVEKTPEGYLVHIGKESPAVTEDVAMTVGAEFNTCVLFDRYKIAPSTEDLQFYEENKLLFVPGKEEA